jgi:hypothetical protein
MKIMGSAFSLDSYCNLVTHANITLKFRNVRKATCAGTALNNSFTNRINSNCFSYWKYATLSQVLLRPTLDWGSSQVHIPRNQFWTHLKQLESLSCTLACMLVLQIMRFLGGGMGGGTN